MAGIKLELHPGRLLPADPPARAVARRRYDQVGPPPLIAPHRYVDPDVLLDNRPFQDPTSLLATPGHYVTVTEAGYLRGPDGGLDTDRPEVRDMARLLDPGLLDWLDQSLAVVTTAVDRITPRPASDEARHVLDATPEAKS